LETERLILREVRESDFDALYRLQSDPEIKRYELSKPSTKSETHKFIRRCLRDRTGRARWRYELAVALPETDLLIGNLDLARIGWGGRTAHVGFMVDRAHWGQGYATEAGSAAVEYAFRHLGVQRVIAQCHPNNVGSWRVMEKMGMRRIKARTRLRLGSGEWFSSIMYEIRNDPSTSL
jgi:RimJ/RimL family protein N-acetyltransferase